MTLNTLGLHNIARPIFLEVTTLDLHTSKPLVVLTKANNLPLLPITNVYPTNILLSKLPPLTNDWFTAVEHWSG